MKKYKLKVKFIPYCDYIIFTHDHYVVKRRYLGFFWKTKEYFYVGEERYKSKTLEEAKQKAIDYMNNYCEELVKIKLHKKGLKEAYKEQRKWEKNETVYKTCECDK